MAIFRADLPDELIQMFQTLERDTEKMLGEMVTAGAEVVKGNVSANMPPEFRRALITRGDAVRLSRRVYKTPSDDGINRQVMIDGYFKNRYGQKTPAPLVANMFEYGSSKRTYPKKPFLRKSFRKNQIEQAMLKIQDKYIKGGEA